MTTRTITGNIKSLTDSAVATGTVTFEKLVTSTTGSTIHQSGVTTATTDASGDFSIALAVPASGSYRYRMILPNGASFYFSIASGASVNVATLIVAETIEDSDAIVEALAAYVPLAGNATISGQLNFSGTTHAGIKLLSLTTAQRDALTPANGMVIYNSTDGEVQTYQGAAWNAVVGMPYDATLAAIAALGTAANKYLYTTGVDSWTEGEITAFARTVLDDSDQSTMLATIGAAPASNLTTHTGLSTTAHGGILPEDASIVAVSSGRNLASTDAGKILECTGTFTLTCPNGLDTGFQCAVVNISTGVITLAATTTLTSKDSAVTLANQYGGATVYHAGSNVWRAIGDLS